MELFVENAKQTEKNYNSAMHHRHGNKSCFHNAGANSISDAQSKEAFFETLFFRNNEANDVVEKSISRLFAQEREGKTHPVLSVDSSPWGIIT